MATYNTAFGALPSTKTLTGRTNTTGRAPAEERQPRNFMQQYAAQRQGGQQPQPQDQTFADLQRQGRARPAPMMTPTMAPGAQPSPFLSQVQGVVTAPPITPNRTRPAQPAAPQTQPQTPQAPQVPQIPQAPQVPQAPQTAMPGPGPITSTAPTAGVPPFGTAPPPATPMAPPAGVTPFEAMPPSGLAAQVAGVVGVQAPGAAGVAYTDQNLPPANAPEGSTYRDATGRTFTRRMGRWSAEGGTSRGGADFREGYESLLPTWMARSGQQGGFGITGVDQFMRTYGRPETPEQMEQLAANAGMSATQLQAFIATRSIPTASQIREQREEGDYQRSAGLLDPATGYLRERKPDWAVFVPASQGGPRYRAMTFEERRAYIARSGDPNALQYVQRPEQYQQFLRQQPDFAGALSGRPPAAATAPAGGEPAGGEPEGGETAGGESAPWEGSPGTWGPGEFAGAVRFDANGMRYTWNGSVWTTSAADTGASGTPAVGAGVGATSTPGAAQTPVGTTGRTPPRTPTGAPEMPEYDTTRSDAMMARLNALFDRLSGGATDEERKALEAERAARTADLTAQFGGQRTALEEELARRGLYASSIGGGRLGDLGGQQARALAGMEAEILNKQAELAADRQRQLMTGLTSVFGTQAEVEYRAQQLQQEARLRGREMDINEARYIAQEEIDKDELALRRELGGQTYGLGRDQFIVDLIRAVGSGNVDPETIRKLLEQFGLKGAADGVTPPPGSDDDPMRGGGNPSDPNSWPAGSRDGLERSTPDGTVYVYRAALRRWVPKPPPGSTGTTGTQP